MLLVLFIAALAGGAVLFRWLNGTSLTQYDLGYPTPLGGVEPSPESLVIEQQVREFTGSNTGGFPGRAKITGLRQAMDGLTDDYRIQSSHRVGGTGTTPPGEWFVPEGADSRFRVLYLHGGGFVAGSPRSHRQLTDGLAQTTGMAVFSLDYRLMPEHSRLACIDDVLQAWEWIAQFGPDGEQSASRLVLAGDSAGGCLVLATLQLLRECQGRQPDAAVAIAPLTDSALHSPSLRFNRDRDLLLGGDLGRFASLPALLRHLMFALASRRSPADPILSPVRGDLQDLPPTLLQASDSEMLLDDSARYCHRARSAGSPVAFETFANMIHVWHVFWPRSPESEAAIDRIAVFLADAGCLPETVLSDSPDAALEGSHA